MSTQNFTDDFTDQSTNGFFIVGLGASAGGIQALKQFFYQVPADSGMAYVVILHLSPDHDSKLAAVLQSFSKLPVTQVTEKTKVDPDNIYVVPPNQHLILQDGYIIPSINIHVEERRAPVDIFFRTLAETHGSKAICVVLSGTGANGSMGLKRVKERGGAVFVQNPVEAEFNEMPRNAIATDMVDDILPVAEIPAKIIAYSNALGTVRISTDKRPEEEQQALREIFTQLRLRTGHDFSNYKRPTLLRRIERRINIRNKANLPDYADYFRQNSEETKALMKDLLISVTNFFRDKKAWEVLEEEILPKIFKDKKAGDQVRIWVAGCATGEEAYSLAMLCLEKTSGILDAPKIQLFATDLDEAAIVAAREGFYTINDAADVSPERLRRFFSREGDGYRVRREVRETILFAHHNFLKDPPFSHVDLVSCRNVLIYLNQIAQERVSETFHFALNPGSYLFLGLSESVDNASDLFSSVSREHHIFQSRPVNTRYYPMPEATPRYNPEQLKVSANTYTDIRTNDRISYGDLHHQLLEQYAPPSLILNAEYDIVHVSEGAGKYLQVSGGEVSRNLLKLINPELRLDIRSALFQASEKQAPVEVRGLKLNLNEKTETVNIHIRPVFRPDQRGQGFILILFEQAVTEEDAENKEVIRPADDSAARHLEEELMRMKTQLRNTIEQYEFQGEELKASNEELQAMNEELRSSAEELETSKEELQSINEEMRTVNQELKVKIEETILANNNLLNLISSADIGTIFLDRNFKVALFTPSIRTIFNLIDSDFGRPITDITNNLLYSDLLKDAEAVLNKLTVLEREVNTKDHRVFMMRLLPYRTSDDRINGVVVTFFDITSRKNAEDSVHESHQRFKLLTNTVPQLIWASDENGNPNYFNERWFEFSGVGEEESGGKGWEAIVHPEDAEHSKKIWHNALAAGKVFDMDFRLRRADGNYRWFIARSVPLKDDQKKIIGWVGSATDVEHLKRTEEMLQAATNRLQLALDAGKLGSYEYDLKTGEFFVNPQNKEIFGYAGEDNITHEQFISFIFPEDRTFLKAAWEKAKLNHTIFDVEYRLRLRDGSMRWVKSAGQAVYNKKGEPDRIVAVTIDITRQKIFTEQLSNEVNARTVELQRSNRDLLQFAHVASHDLKEPARKIKTFNGMLTKEFADVIPEKANVYLDKIKAASDRMLSMIDGILKYSKIGMNDQSIENVVLNKIIDQVKTDLELMVHEKNAVINRTGLPTIKANNTLIYQLFYNLLHNALKFAKNDVSSVIDISSDIIKKEGRDFVKVTITDNGIGFSPEYSEDIFEAFTRLNAKDAYEGTGLGLALCKKIVERNYGELSANSEPGVGATFTVLLPID